MTPPYDPSSIRVLLVAADPQTVKSAGSLLKNDGFDIYLAHTLAQAAARCMEEDIDLVVCSAGQGEADPFALCRGMDGAEGRGKAPPPFIFLVDRTDPGAMGRAFRAGAADCVSMPCQSEEFLARVRRELELIHARRSMADQRRELDDAWSRIEAFRRLDPLTGLPDREYALLRLEDELAPGRRSIVRSVIIASLPETPTEAGERILKPMASLFKAMLRDHDILCRWSEAQLILILGECGRQGATALLDRFSRVLSQMEPLSCQAPSGTKPSFHLIVLGETREDGRDQEDELRALLSPNPPAR